LFPIHPCAYIKRTISEFNALRLALSQKIDRGQVHQRELFQIKRDFRTAVFNKRPQLGKVLGAQMANKP
jgi:hypothetical protein